MAIEYVADTEWEEQPEWSLQINDRGGADTLSRPYRGNAETLGEFLKQFPKQSPDPAYPQLKREGALISGDRSFPTVTLQYKGIFDDDLPEVQKSGGWRRQTATLIMQPLDGSETEREDSSTQCTIIYYAPTSTFRYVTRKQPTAQKYAGQILQTDAAWEIRQIRGATDVQLYEARPAGWQAGITTGGTIRPGFFNFVRTVGTSIFTFTQAGDYWEVVEENEGLIEMVERSDLPRLLTSKDVAAAYA